MKLIVVGTSCTWFKRYNTSFIIDDEALFDVPEGNYEHILRFIDVMKLKWIFISHLHTDHAAGLHIITTRFLRETKDKNKRLRIYAPKETAETIVKYCTIFNGAPEERDLNLLKEKIEFIDLYDGMEFEESEYKIKVKKMNHGSVECYGLIFEDKKTGKVISFSSDTKDCSALHEMLSVSNYSFVDMAANKPSKSHLTNIEFVELEKKYKNCKMFPVHTNDVCQEFAIKNNLNYLKDGQVLNLD